MADDLHRTALVSDALFGIATCPPFVEELETTADDPNLTRAMQRRGWSEARIRAMLGENWLRFLGEVWF
jgi:microsomal dipeptidase-like Zn-dependent dipeptidase